MNFLQIYIALKIQLCFVANDTMNLSDVRVLQALQVLGNSIIKFVK